MRRAAILALVLMGVVTLTAPAGASSSEAGAQLASIPEAAIAPFRDALARNAKALCADFVPSVAAALVPAAAPGVGCQAAAEQVFSATAPNEPSTLGAPVLEHPPTGMHLEVTATHATITLHFSDPLTVNLEELNGVWLVSSGAKLEAIPGCHLLFPHSCPLDAMVLVFTYGEYATQPFGPPVPLAVKRAGVRVTHEFEAGRTDVDQSGCLACHRLGQSGNRGPGQNLTRIGATLSRSQIEHVILHPRAPMPSFKHLPPRKLHDIVRFLSLLR